MDELDDARALWISRHILPYESILRKSIGRWRLPFGLEAEDIIQESYAKIASLPSVDDIRSPRAYFLQIARSIWLMHIRRARLIPIDAVIQFEQTSVADDIPSPEVEVSDRQQLEHLAQAVARIPEPNRSVFRLRLIHELSHREIGQRLGLSENAVQKKLARTLNFLALQIGRGGNQAVQASIIVDKMQSRRSDDD